MFITISWVVATFIVFSLASRVYKSHYNAALSRRLRCFEPPSRYIRWPLGLGLIYDSLQADRAKQFPVFIAKSVEDQGFNTWRYSILGITNLFTADPMNIKAMLSTQFDDFELGPIRRGIFWPMLGNGIFTQDGRAWKASRDMMRPQFVREQISDIDLEERHVQNLMRAIDARLQPKSRWTGEMDLQSLFFRHTMDTATEFLFGQSVNDQILNLPENGKRENDELSFAGAFDNGQSWLAFRGRFADKYWLVTGKSFTKACRVCQDFIDQFVQVALARKSSGKIDDDQDALSTKKRFVFLDALVNETQDPIELRSQLLHLLLAGRDTTASLLGWLFFLLVRDPERYQKLRTAVIESFGTYTDPNHITFSALKDCQYLQHCISETLRLYPSVPLNSRYANKNTTLPSGGGTDGKSKIFIPKGTMCDYSVYAMHRRKDLWGEDAEDFRPERWDAKKVGWEYLPFNGGPRVCIGQQFALTEASYVTVRILQRFDKLENMETDPVVRHNQTITDCSANGVKVKLHSAQEI